MSTWNEEEDGMGFAGLVPTAAEKRAEREEAQRIARENEKLNMAYAEGRKDEREASCVDELVAALKDALETLEYLQKAPDSAYARPDEDTIINGRAVLTKLEQTK